VQIKPKWLLGQKSLNPRPEWKGTPMLTSVNTNIGAMVALQNLNSTSSKLQETQNRISTGLKVGSAKDNGASYAIAQTQRATVQSLNAVTDSLNRGTSAVDVAMSAGESVSDMLTQMKEKALAASDTSLDTTSREALNTDFAALRAQIPKTVTNAKFNGINLLDNSMTGDLQILANADGTATLTVGLQDLRVGQGIV